ncbi:ABC transporter substrate-binding protein [Chloroflexota bacterium]
MFEYHPDKAKELLAEAGYPNGFKATVTTHGTAEVVDLLSIVKDNWSKIGVDLEIDMKEFGVWRSIQAARSNPDMFVHNPNAINPKQIYSAPNDINNTGRVDDPYLNERVGGIFSFENVNNPAEQQKLFGEIQLHELEQMHWIQLPMPYKYNMWWPWVQNYHGVAFVGYIGYYRYAEYAWLDTALKEAMVGR